MALTIAHKHLVKIAAAGALLLSATAQSLPMFSNAYVFGDSLSDAGNIKASLGPLGDALGTSIGYGSNGRFSNGPVWHEYLILNDDLLVQDNLGVSENGGTNYAYGGALVDSSGGLPGGIVESAVGQVGDYLGSVNSLADPDALYITWIGGNDVRGLVGNSDPWDEVEEALDSMQEMLGALLAAGASTLFVPNLPDIGAIPEFAGDASDIQSAHNITVAWNDGLKQRLISLHDDYLLADIFYFDVFDLFEQLIADPGLYGYTDVTGQCRSTTSVAEIECADADTTLFWDYVHPTTGAHELLAERAAIELRQGSQVPVPSSALLVLCGLGFFAGRARATRRL